jgi:DNA-binding NarL/FixJ family response regulator
VVIIAYLNDGKTYKDRISKTCALIRRAFKLSAREVEVLDFIVRGNSVSGIAQRLTVSENTVRTHYKRIYVKLGVHKRQELLDLIESLELPARNL